jgi:hypothetical protein
MIRMNMRITDFGHHFLFRNEVMAIDKTIALGDRIDGGMAEWFKANDLKNRGMPNLPHTSVDRVRLIVTHMAVNDDLSRKRGRKRP